MVRVNTTAPPSQVCESIFPINNYSSSKSEHFYSLIEWRGTHFRIGAKGTYWPLSASPPIGLQTVPTESCQLSTRLCRARKGFYGPSKKRPPAEDSKKKDPRAQRGLNSEELAIEYFVKTGGELKAHRKKVGGCEVDLIFFVPTGEWWIVEVKTMSPHLSPLDVLSRRQVQRLNRARETLQANTKFPVRVHLAIVSHDREIEVFKDVLCELL